MNRFDRNAPSDEGATPAVRRVVAFDAGPAAQSEDARRTHPNPTAKAADPNGPRDSKRLAARLERATRRVAADAMKDADRNPLEVMLENMSWAVRRARRLEQVLAGVEAKEHTAEIVSYRELAQAAAQAAAPYFHPKLAPVLAKGTTGVAVTFTIEDA